MQSRYDAIVLGSGVGGSCAAALLAHQGMKVLLAEKRTYLGGRFSTSEHDGYKCATGGLAVQVGGPIEKICAELGIESGVRQASRSAWWIDGLLHEITATQGSLRSTIKQVANSPEEAQRVIAALGDALNWLEPGDELSFRDWLAQYTPNPRIHSLFQATISALLTVNAHELPAAEYFKLVKNIPRLRFGYVEGGSLRLWERMAEVVRAHGGDVLTGCAAVGIAQLHGQVRGARLRWQRQDYAVEAPIVVSNLGPQATVEFTGREAFEHSYLAHLDRHVHPTAILWLHFCSDERVLDYSAIAVCGTRRVNMIDSPSYDCPDTAPPGKHLYTVGGAPPNALAPGDLDAEFAEVMADLREIIPGFDERCRVLTRTCYRGKWPGFRTVPGSPVSHRTPVKGLFNVGDAACPRGYAGSMGAATSALLVRDDLRRVG